MLYSDFKDLKVWQKSIDLCQDIYCLIDIFPKSETFGLVSQIRRSAISIPSNIAEGQARHADKEFIRFLNIAYGSLAELETQLIISVKVGYSKEDIIDGLNAKIKEIGRMIMALINSIEKNLATQKLNNSETQQLRNSNNGTIQ